MNKELTQEQRKRIRQYVEKYKEHLKTQKGQDWRKERKDRVAFFRTVLSKDNIPKLTEDVFGEIIRGLWASDFWTNKDYLVNKILKDNGLPKIREELMELLYGGSSIDKRFDRFKRNIKGLGPSSVTEILHFTFPDELCIWNDKSKNVLPFLGMKTLLLDRVYKYSINGKEYIQCTKILGLIIEELTSCGLEDVNFLDADHFMWFVFSEIMPKEPLPKPPKPPTVEIPKVIELDHWSAMGLLVELGNLLGYDTYVSDPSKEYGDETLGDIATLKEIPHFATDDVVDVARYIDVIWFQEEYPQYCFEVEHTTNVSSGLLRLFQLSPLKYIRFIVVSPLDVFPKFKKEINKIPFKRIQNRYNFKSYEELREWFKVAKKYHELKRSFLGE